jgi:hypothetical protein
VARHRRPIAVTYGLAAVAAVVFVAACGGSTARVTTATEKTTGRAHAAQAGGTVVGIISGTVGWSDQGVGERLTQVISRTHAKWLRESFYWSEIEPRPGVFRFAHYDHFMVTAARRHEQVLALLDNAPSWASPTPISIPSDPAGYSRFVAAVVHRYGPNGTLWQQHPNLRGSAVSTFDLWNEPYYPNGNNGNYDPGRYARLVKAATTAGRAADAQAKFLIAAEMQGTFSPSSHRWVWWVDSIYQAVPDLNNYFDGVSVHPYGHDITKLSPALSGRPYYGYEQMRRIELIRKQFVAHGAAAKPFWSTEVGWPTCARGSNRCVSVAGQAASLRALLHYSQTRWKGWMRAAFIYYLDDARGSTANPDNDYGLTYHNLRAKPSLKIFASAAQASPTTAWSGTP